MDCPDCTTAQTKPTCFYTAGCRGCTVRMLARCEDFFLAERAGRLTASYRHVLTLALGDVEAHAEVKAEAERLKAMEPAA